MRRMGSRAAWIVFWIACWVAGAATAGPSVGDPAPPFELQGSDGHSYRLSDFVGERGVVLAWFPKAFTPG